MEFKYSSKNTFQNSGKTSCFPELVNLRNHIEPEIVLQSGNLIKNIHDFSESGGKKANAEALLKTNKLESTVIAIDFEGIDSEEVGLAFDKGMVNDEMELIC